MFSKIPCHTFVTGELLSTVDTRQMNNTYGCVSPCGRFVASSGLTSFSLTHRISQITYWYVQHDTILCEIFYTVLKCWCRNHLNLLHCARNGKPNEKETKNKKWYSSEL